MFDVVADAVRDLTPLRLGEVRVKPRQWGVKVWFGAGPNAGPEHYEAQIMGAKADPRATALVLEVGFHAEHPKEADNDATIDRLVAHESRWRKILGPEAEIDAFLGRADHWRRISELWIDPDLSDPGIGIDVASRLVDYMTALEPHRR